MSTTTADFSAAVEAVVSGIGTAGVMDRFAANDALLDLLGVATNDGETALVLGALAALPKSGLVSRSEVAALLAGLAGQN